MEIVTAFEAYAAWLKKSAENGHFHACSPMKFSNDTNILWVKTDSYFSLLEEKYTYTKCAYNLKNLIS